jgi:hypothetical protein
VAKRQPLFATVGLTTEQLNEDPSSKLYPSFKKKISKNCPIFFAPQTHHPKHHSHHTLHHELTIKTPRFDATFSKKTLEKQGFSLPVFFSHN